MSWLLPGPPHGPRRQRLAFAPTGWDRTAAQEVQMVKHFDHVTIVVTDVDRAKRFFALLGFQEAMSVVISGEQFSRYMGVAEIEAEHHTMVLTNSAPRLEVQLLKYRHPDAIPNPKLATLREIGFNHVC